MKYTVPDYYKKFSCIASECPATCCAGWQIVIDDKSLKKYKNCKSVFGNRLANSIDWEEKTFHQYGGRCAFLDEQNLCDIYSEAGPDMLCKTCQRYPRHMEEFENEREISLSISCPVVAKLLLNRKEKVTFLTREDEREEEEDESFDFFLYSALQDCRSVMIEILQNREETIAFRMAKVLALAHDVQNRINAAKVFEIEAVLDRYQRPGADAKLKKKFETYVEQPGQKERKQALIMLLDELEVLDPSWPGQLEEFRKKLYVSENSTDRAGISKTQAGKWIETDCSNVQAGAERETDRKWKQQTDAGKSGEIRDEQLMVYFLFTYFCGAIYDGDALAKVKMAVVSTLILRELIQADPAEQMRTVWRYSRELEHSDQNLNRMEELMNEALAAEFHELLKYILY